MILPITIDTREQRPLRFDPSRAAVTIATVPVFDYAVTGSECKFSIERKSAGDLIGSFLNKDNAKNELEKVEKARQLWGQEYPIIYAVEASYYGIKQSAFRYFHRQITFDQLDSVLSFWEIAYNVHFVWCGERSGVARYIYRRLKRFYEQTM